MTPYTPWLLLPDDDIVPAVAKRFRAVPYLRFSEASDGRMHNVEFYVPPYLGGPEVLEIVDRMPRLSVVQLLTAGVDWVAGRVPPDVTVCNARGVHEVSTAEWVLTAVLAATRGLPGFVRAQAERRWEHRRTDVLAGKSVLILGYGAIGRAVEQRLQPFGVRVVRVAKRGADGVHPVAALPGLLGDTDVLVVTAPLTADTQGLVDEAVLSRLPDGALVVNASRGPLVVAADLERHLVAGRLRAALDVTDPEPLPPDSALWELDNVLITPHIGGDTTYFPQAAGALVCDQIARYLAQEPLHNVLSGSY
jgi:phosphoglycerate dehydrogenase-like enzyme